MKTSTFALAVLATSVAAVPHPRHANQHQHAHPVRRDVDVVTTAVVETQRAVLYVDQNGNPISTSMVVVDAAPTDAAVEAADYGSPSSEDAPPPPPPQKTPAPPAYTEPTPDTSSPAPPPQSPSAGADGEVENISGYSIAYAPYNADHSCKSKNEIDADIDNLKDDNYQMVRIYGTDCDQVPNIVSAAKRNNMKVFAGIWDVNNVAEEAQLLIDGAGKDWNMIHTVSVGNEVLNSGGSLSSVINGITSARSILRQAGYEGPVTTVEVYRTIMMEENLGLCDAVDYVAANCHPFFNSGLSAEEAGDYVREQADKLSDWCVDKKDVVITESGWPSGGETNGKAVPGAENQRIALKSLRSAYVDNPNGLVLFSAYNDLWKQDTARTFGAEHFWGIYGTAPSAR